jgi:hypothetical protein
MRRLHRTYLELLRTQPAWYRLVIFAGVVPMIGLGVAHHRGTGLGLVCAACMAVAFLPGTLSMERTRAWSARHPLLDSLIMLPVFFVSAVYFCRSQSALWCFGMAAIGMTVGAASGLVRRRATARGNRHATP